MKKIFSKSLLLISLVGGSLSTQAQYATQLTFPFANTIDHEFGFSSVEYNGYSAIGTEFNSMIKVFKNGNFIFEKTGPSTSRFGHSLTMSGNCLIAGAPQYDATPSNTNSNNEGAVYVSAHVNGQPSSNFSTVLLAQTSANNDYFGVSVDIDNQWLVVGASQPNSGTGYIEIWQQNGSSWVRKQRIQPSNLTFDARFGSAVAIRGNYMIAGAYNDNKVYLFKNTNGIWAQVAEYTPNKPEWAQVAYDWYGNPVYSLRFGFSVDITDGYAIVGDPVAEKAAIFSINNNQLVRTHVLKAPANPDPNITFDGQFGHSVAILWNRALVGAPNSFYPTNGSSTNYKGNVFLYTDNYQYKGRMNTGNPTSIIQRGLGRSLSIHSDIILAGAEWSADLTLPDSYQFKNAYGSAFRMPFWYVYQSGNTRFMSKETFITDEPSTFEIYPNPADVAEVTLNTKENVLSVTAIAVDGTTTKLNHQENNVNIQPLKSGIYQLTVQLESGVATQRFIKK